MALTDKQVKVGKECEELCNVVIGAVKAFKEGGDYKTLLPDLFKAIEGLAEARKELDEHTWEVVKGVLLTAVDVAEALVSKKDDGEAKPVPVSKQEKKDQPISNDKPAAPTPPNA